MTPNRPIAFSLIALLSLFIVSRAQADLTFMTANEISQIDASIDIQPGITESIPVLTLDKPLVATGSLLASEEKVNDAIVYLFEVPNSENNKKVLVKTTLSDFSKDVDMDIFLFNQHLQELDSSTSIETPTEVITKYLSPGIYAVQVYNATYDPSSYRLQIEQAPTQPYKDTAGASLLTSLDLGVLSKEKAFQQMESIQPLASGADVDIFKLSIPSEMAYPSEIRITVEAMNPIEGQGEDLTFNVLDKDGRALKVVDDGVSGIEGTLLYVGGPSEIYIQVQGYSEDDNVNYNLTVEAL